MPYIFLLYAIAPYFLLLAANYAVLLQRLSATTFQYVRYTLKSPQEIPSYLKDFLAAIQPELQPLGFEFCDYFELENIDGSQYWGVLMQHPASSTFATVQLQTLPDPANPTTITLHTFLDATLDAKSRAAQSTQDHVSSSLPTLLMTFNGLLHCVVGKLPKTIAQDHYVTDVAQQWKNHSAKLQTLSPQLCPRSLSPQEFIAELENHERLYIDHLVKTGTFAKAEQPAQFHVRLWPAMKSAGRMLQGMGKQGNMLKKRIAQAKINTDLQLDIPVEAEVEAFRRLESIEKKRPRRSLKLGILIISLGVFALSFTTLFSWQDVLILAGVLFLHELGHFAAMRRFGYENTSIFFLPFFGAAASGRKDHATLVEKFVVLVAGPLPGLLLGIGLGLLPAIALVGLPNPAYPEWAGLGIGFLIILNYLNLLPIFPLDGGRIINLLLFSQSIWADIGFKILTIGAIVLLGAGIGDFFILALAVFVALGLPASFRTARIVRQVNEAELRTHNNLDQQLAILFSALKTADLDNLAFSQKYMLVKGLVQRYQEPIASWQTRLMLVSVYLVLVIGGLIGGFLGLTTVFST